MSNERFWGAEARVAAELIGASLPTVEESTVGGGVMLLSCAVVCRTRVIEVEKWLRAQEAPKYPRNNKP